MTNRKYENGGPDGLTPISGLLPGQGWLSSTSTDRKAPRSLRNLLRRTVHPLRHSLARQDLVFTFFTSYALDRLKFGLRPVARSTSEAREVTSSRRPPTIILAEPIDG